MADDTPTSNSGLSPPNSRRVVRVRIPRGTRYVRIQGANGNEAPAAVDSAEDQQQQQQQQAAPGVFGHQGPLRFAMPPRAVPGGPHLIPIESLLQPQSPSLEVRPLPDTQQELNAQAQNEALEGVPHCIICWEHCSRDIRKCPYSDTCQARLCGECWIKYLSQQSTQNGSTLDCPLCRRAVSDFILDQALAQHLRDSVPPVPCRYSRCEAVVPFADLGTHETTCDWQRVSCRYQRIGCPWTGWRMHVETHLEQDCRFHPMQDFIESQRQIQDRQQAQISILSQQIAVQQQTIQQMNQRFQQRFQHHEGRILVLEQRRTFSWVSRTRRLLQSPYLTLFQILRHWTIVARRPRLLQRYARNPMGVNMSISCDALPESIVATCAAFDMMFTCYMNRISIPWLTVGILFALPWTHRLDKLIPRSSVGALNVRTWIYWCMILWWYRHTDQCLTIWLTTAAASCLGLSLFGTTPMSLHPRLFVSALSWVTVAYGLGPTIVVAMILLLAMVSPISVHQFGMAYSVAKYLVFLPLVPLYCFPFVWGAFGMFLLFAVGGHAIFRGSTEIGHCIRQSPKFIPFTTVSSVILVLMSWSIADCLFFPLEAMVDSIVTYSSDSSPMIRPPELSFANDTSTM